VFYTFFFFFQAEDGIRDGHVTGVQTCALPICLAAAAWNIEREVPGGVAAFTGFLGRSEQRANQIEGLDVSHRIRARRAADGRLRSEERRVGKECRTRWRADDGKKIKMRKYT